MFVCTSRGRRPWCPWNRPQHRGASARLPGGEGRGALAKELCGVLGDAGYVMIGGACCDATCTTGTCGTTPATSTNFHSLLLRVICAECSRRVLAASLVMRVPLGTPCDWRHRCASEWRSRLQIIWLIFSCCVVSLHGCFGICVRLQFSGLTSP